MGNAQKSVGSQEGGIGLAIGGINRAEEILDGVGRILSDMSVIVHRMSSESDDIIGRQLAEYFNILRRWIEQALAPAGDNIAEGLMGGKTVEIEMGPGNPKIAIPGDRTGISLKGFDIPELGAGGAGQRLEGIADKIQLAQDRIQQFTTRLTSERSRLAGLRQQGGESTDIAL